MSGKWNGKEKWYSHTAMGERERARSVMFNGLSHVQSNCKFLVWFMFQLVHETTSNSGHSDQQICYSECSWFGHTEKEIDDDDENTNDFIY